MRGADQQILQDTDMAGPLVFCLALGSFLLLVCYLINRYNREKETYTCFCVHRVAR